MATLSNSESRRLYSWWWDSHNTPKNSKWLQDNITDMDGKVKSMIKLIEEDADSFARRAEMYYKKRPELMKLVEEFYRAYRALAERYNHATGELRHAHRTIAAAFPEQVPFELVEYSPSKSLAEDDLIENATSLFPSDKHKKGLKELHEMFGGQETLGGGSKSADEKSRNDPVQDEVLQLSTQNENLKEKVRNETERRGQAEREVDGLKKALVNMEAEKEDVRLQYQQCLKDLSKIERELNNAQMDSTMLNEKASRAEIEVQTLKEALIQLEAEKTAGMVKHEEYLEMISHLDATASRFQEDMKVLDDRSLRAESEAQTLKDEKFRLELEKEEVLHKYNKCLGKISDLENVIKAMENEAIMLKKQAERAETEVFELQKAFADLNTEKEASALQYKFCLETISKLERDISIAKHEVKHLNNEVLIGTAKLKTAEEKCTVLKMSNEALRVEADNLAKKIATKDQELVHKQEELEKLESCLLDENSRHAQVEATLKTLQDLHSQSQDDQSALAIELRNMLQMVKDMEVSKHGLEEEIRQVRDENLGLSQASFCAAVSMDKMQNEILTLSEMREKLEKEVTHHMGISISLQQEISCLKEEIGGLNCSYQAIVEQVEAAGLNPKCIGTSIKCLQDENLRLKQVLENDSNEKATLSKRLENIQEVLNKKIGVESLLSDLNSELETYRDNVKALNESCQSLHGEKATLVVEKTSLLSQLQATTENMNNLLRQNIVLENSLSTAKVELEGLREKSKGLEGICDLLKNERCHLLSERVTLVLKLENVERRLESLEKKFTGLEVKYAGLEKENEAMLCQVENLKVSLGEEKQERIGSQLVSETKLAGLENEIHLLREENRRKKKESEEELDKAVKAQFEISILQKFMKDMEEKNYSLIIECQKHVEASKLAEKLIAELESESLEQQVEAELLLDEIEGLRLAIYQIFRALETGPEDENELTLVHRILESVEDMKCSIEENQDEKQQLLLENSVLVALLEQLESKGMEIELQKSHLEQELKIMANKLGIVNIEKDKLSEINRRLESDVSEGHEAASILKGELGSLCVRRDELQKAYDALQETYSQVNQENTNLLAKLSNLTEEKYEVDQYNDAFHMELLATVNQTVVLKSFASEKITELKSLLEDLNKQHEINGRLKKEMDELNGKLDLEKAENLVLKESLIKTGTKLEAAEKLNSTSLQISENLEKNVFGLSETNSAQEKEIESLRRANKDLESELGLLRQEMEGNKSLNSDFELWEAEEASFCFDLQVSSINEVLLKNKVQELTGVCQTLEHKHAAKTSEIEQVRGKICLMENEISRLKSQLCAYAPVVASLRDDITLVERNALLHTKLQAVHSREMEFLEVAACPGEGTSQIRIEDESLVSLSNLQTRVKAVGKLMEDLNKPVMQKRSDSNSKHETAISEISKHKKSKKKGRVNELNDTPKLQKMKSKDRTGMLMKDIPLDSSSSLRKKGNVGSDDLMLELWETVEDGNSKDQTIGRSSHKLKETRDVVYDQFEDIQGNEPPSTDSDIEKEFGVDNLAFSTRITVPNQEVIDIKILDKLLADGQKLETLQMTVENLRRKLETTKKSRKAKNVDFVTVKEQLQEAEDTIVHLVDLNSQLVKNIEECPPDELQETVKTWRSKVMEQAQKGSDRIDMLQLSVQKIQYVLSKLEDERNSKGNKFLRSRTVILRDFIHNGKSNSGRRKKGPKCGCFRQSNNGNGTSS